MTFFEVVLAIALDSRLSGHRRTVDFVRAPVKRRPYIAHVLLIENEILLATELKQAATKLGYTTFDMVRSQQQAITAAERQCPDLILANHVLLDGTGTDAILEICADKSLPVVFVTGSAKEVRARIPEAIVVEKPFTLPNLQAAVNQASERPFRFSK